MFDSFDPLTRSLTNFKISFPRRPPGPCLCLSQQNRKAGCSLIPNKQRQHIS